MKYFASLCALVLAGSMPGFAVSANHTSVNPENQFHFKPSKHRAAQLAARDAQFAARNNSATQTHEFGKPHGAASKMASPLTPFHSLSAKTVRRRTANPPTGKTGFLAASQIPAGGELYYNTMSGDFNGDGKTDLASEVYAYDSNTTSYIYEISVVLSNGNGTFQAPVLTPITNDDACVALLVGDVNGDGKSDILVGHQPGACGNSYTLPTIDVWLSNGDGTLTLSTNTNNTITTSGLAGGTLADVNGDGKLDLVVVDDNNPANVITLLGNGDGTFQTPTSVALSGQAGNDVIFADLNGDGLLDIVDNDYTSKQVTVYLATSAPPYYQSAVSYSTPTPTYSACSLTVGDLDGNGKPEIVAANCMGSGNDITVYVNNQDGTFQSGVYYNGAMSGGTNSGPAVLDTNAVTIADVNGDGKADIIATNIDSGDVTILSGNGDGTVNPPTVGYATGGYPWNNGPFQMPAIVADFNGDGFADIVVPDQLFSFAYLRGYGDGTFRASLDYYAPSYGYSWTYGIATGDFNNDGHPDFVIGNICSCTTPMGVTVFLSNPDGSMQPGVNFGTTSNFYYVAVADFNNDGNKDIVAIDNGTGQAQIFTGDGTGNFTAGTPFNTDLTNDSPNGVFVGDFNKDGYPDLAIANPNGHDIAILLNDQTGNFPTPVPIALSGNFVQGAGVADLGNGNIDLVLPYQYGSSVAVLLGNGNGTFGTETDYPVGASDPTAVAVADLDGDGKLDIAVTLGQGGGQDIAVATGLGNGTFNAFSTPVQSSLQDFNLSSPSPEYIQAADVDGDGKMDLVYSNTFYSTIGVLFGVGNGTFFDPVEYPVGQTNWGLTVTDVNGDNAPDAVMASYDFAGVTVLLNNNGNSALGSYTIGTSQQGATITAGQSAQFTLTITPYNHYNGTVTLSCPTGLPALATCSFSPSGVVTLDGLTPQTVTLTITTTAPTASLQIPAGIDPRGNSHPGSSTMLLASLNGMGVLGMFVAGGFNKKRNRWSVLAVLALAMSFFLVGCGGSSSNNNNGNTTKSNTTSSVASSAATAMVGQALTFTGTVSANSGTPTGTVTFLDGTKSLGTGTLSSGKATFQTSSLAAGVHSITIAYGGDSSFNASNSTALSETVDNATTSSITSSTVTTLVGQAVTFTGTVSSSSGTPTGTVTFLDGTTTLGTGTLSSGKATFQTSSLVAGVHTITMAYGGASNFAASTSTALSETVDNPGTSSGSYQVTVGATGTAGTNGVGSPNQSVNLTIVVQ